MKIFLPAITALTLASGASAQLDLAWSDGVLGSSANYELAGDANEVWILIPSFNAGPTPLPGGTLDVGVDLLAYFSFGLLNASGVGTVSYPLPAAPILSGLTFHAQAFTLTGVGFPIDDLSNSVRFAFGLPGDTVATLTDGVEARRFHTSTPLPDGSVLVAGGESASAPTSYSATWEIYDPQVQSFSVGGAAMTDARSHHTASSLADGCVLVVGGVGAAGVLDSVEIYDPVTGVFSAAAPMASPRVLHTATVLADGRVFVAGGVSAFSDGHPFGYPASVAGGAGTPATEIYDPLSDTWSPGPALPSGLAAATAGRLGDDRVLIAGGIEIGAAGVTAVTTDAAYLFDPGSGILTGTMAMPSKRFHQGVTPTHVGTVIVTGGTEVDFGTLSASVHGDTYAFDPVLEAWSVLPSVTTGVRCGVMVCIGYFDPESGTTKYHYLLGGGLENMVVISGIGTINEVLYQLDEDFTGWTATGSTLLPRPGMTLTPIDDGLRALITGAGAAPDQSASTFVFVP